MTTTQQPSKGCLSFIILALICAAAFAAWMVWPGRFSQFNYLRVQDGMSLDQVTHLLGPGQVTEYVPQHQRHMGKPGVPPDWIGVVWGDTFVHWRDDACDIYVGFSEGQVTSKHYYEPSF